ncbi:hypothetical protein ACIRQY_17790 [Streptomyces sp. NPDC101490]|uniref:hypothetical protein n=1 Tax=unclassified Streptomyces TaxID=2593676 RepID=UPI00333426DA
MDKKRIATATALTLTTLMVFAWSVPMAATGYEALAAVVALLLGLTVTRAPHVVRPRTPACGHRVAAVPDKGDDAP